MPIHKEEGGYQWGNHGKVYHGPEAKKEAEAQAAAAHAHGFQGDAPQLLPVEKTLTEISETNRRFWEQK